MDWQITGGERIDGDTFRLGLYCDEHGDVDVAVHCRWLGERRMAYLCDAWIKSVRSDDPRVVREVWAWLSPQLRDVGWDACLTAAAK